MVTRGPPGRLNRDGDHGAADPLAEIRLHVGVVEDAPYHPPPAPGLLAADDDVVGVLADHLVEDGLLDQEPGTDDVPRPVDGTELGLDGTLELRSGDPAGVLVEVDVEHGEVRVVLLGEVDGAAEGRTGVFGERIADGDHDQRHSSRDTAPPDSTLSFRSTVERFPVPRRTTVSDAVSDDPSLDPRRDTLAPGGGREHLVLDVQRAHQELVYTGYLLRSGAEEDSSPATPDDPVGIPDSVTERVQFRGRDAVLLVAGLAIVLVSGDLMVAAGTSTPEFAVSLVAVRRGRLGISVGNVVGSNVFNLVGILGVAAAVRPLSLSGATGSSLWWLVAISVVVVVALWTGRKLSRPEGGLLVGSEVLRWILGLLGIA